jgi:hypothetical protein
MMNNNSNTLVERIVKVIDHAADARGLESVGTRVFNDTQENHTCIERMAATHTLHTGFVKSTT